RHRLCQQRLLRSRHAGCAVRLCGINGACQVFAARRGDRMSTALPLWAEVITAVFAVLGAAFAAVGSFGLVRLPTFFNRIHTPTLGSTAGVWCITIATIVYF